MKYVEGGYFRKLPADPWGNPYIYRSHGLDGPIYVISCGPDGIEGTEDDIIDYNEKVAKRRIERAAGYTGTIVPSVRFNSVTIGDLPEENDSSLVLRRGRTITVTIGKNINSEVSTEGIHNLYIVENLYDDSDRNLLYRRTRIRCLYKISEDQDKIRINFTAVEMSLDPFSVNLVLFSDPPHITTACMQVRHLNEVLRNTNMNKIEEEILLLREQLFLSPVMSAELILGVESEDRTSDIGKVIFCKNVSGDRTVFIGWGYRINLHVEKDILFSTVPSSVQGRIEHREDHANNEPPQVFISDNNVFIADITEENKDAHIIFSSWSQFRRIHLERYPYDMHNKVYYPHHILEKLMITLWPTNISRIQHLWDKLYDELSDATDPVRFKIPYAFAFNFTREEHLLCKAQPDEVLNIVQGKESVLTWISEEIQWGDKLRIRYLRDYIKILKDNGFDDWAETVENLEGKNYLYDY